MNAPDKAVAFEALMKDTPGFDHYDRPSIQFIIILIQMK